jgi:hypothetical protein
MDFQPDGELELSTDSFKSTFMHVSHLFAKGLFGMVFEHLQDAFDFKDCTNDFIQLHSLSFHIAMGSFPSSTIHILVGFWLWPSFRVASN